MEALIILSIVYLCGVIICMGFIIRDRLVDIIEELKSLKTEITKLER